MQLKLKTTKLQEMLSKAVKGASNNKLIPLTSLIAIEVKEGVLTLTTTDATNYFYVTEPNIDCEDFYVVVQVDMLSKLISKMTCDTITLDVDTSFLCVTGNGTYKLEIPMDEDGEVVRYPNPLENFSEAYKLGTINLPTIKKIVGSLKQSLMTTPDYPWYSCYYVGDSSIIATDTYKISCLKNGIFTLPKLVSAEQMNLLDVFGDDAIEVYMDGNKMLFRGAHCTLYGIEPIGIESFSIDAINALIDSKFERMCKLSKNDMVRLLDRISLFVGAYDNGEIELMFTSSGLQVKSRMSTGVESVSYIETENFAEFACNVDINMITSQIKAQASDVIELWFGDDNALKIVDTDTISIVALLVD